MVVESLITKKVTGFILDKSLNYFSSLFNDDEANAKNISKDLEQGLLNQINKAIKFSSNLETFRYEDKRDITENTIALSIKNSIRQSFQSVAEKNAITEEELLINSRSQLILGDPGAGKTTTLKRLISESHKYIFEEDDEHFNYSLPLFFKLAEIESNESFFTYFAKSLGIAYDTIAKEVEYEEMEIKKINDPENEFSDENGNVEQEISVKKKKIEYEYKIGDLALGVALSQFINEINVIIFLDGLDELHYIIRDKVFNELKQLLSLLNNSKLIISSRYFEDVDRFKNIDKNEILPLSESKSLKISQQWVDDPHQFWQELSLKPYNDLATRPLFLFYLLMLYRGNRGALPGQGVDVYRQVVLLVLREWDDHKEYKSFRFSKIKNFNTYKKEEFVSHIAFNLTYKLGIKRVFNRSDLSKTFYSIKGKFPDLNSVDASEVIKDIETDNGLIITSVENEYEFSHLTLQEYLCARHIISLPFSKKIYDCMKSNPEPLALTVILSPEPESWFSMLVLNNINERQHDRRLSSSIIYTFINRLISEGLNFTNISAELGMAVIHLIFVGHSSTRVSSTLERFLGNKIVLKSTKLAMKKFELGTKNKFKEEVTIKRVSEFHSDLFLIFPEEGVLPERIWKKVK